MHILDLLFPPRCEGCGKVGSYICGKCALTVELREQRCPECDRLAIDGMTHVKCQHPYGLNGLTTVFTYTGVVKKVLKTIKYSFVYDEARSLINLIPNPTWDLLKNLTQNNVIYPIPLHKERLKWRGFNQAEKLAGFIGKRLGLPVVSGLLVRTEKRPPQADITHREDRIKNARGLFIISANRVRPLTPLRSDPDTITSILLVDDVWTTGATMKEAAKVLKRNGVRKVWGLTIAR